MSAYAHAVRRLLWIGCCALALPVSGADYDYLEYDVRYRGTLTANQFVTVAKAVWVAPPPNAGDKARISLRISTQDHGTLESIVPFRICYKSEFHAGHRRILGIENFHRGGRKLFYTLANFDWPKGEVKQYLARAKMPSSFDPFDLGSRKKTALKWEEKRRTVPLEHSVLDRLSMIQYMRGMKLRDGQVVGVPVSDGKRMLEYWVTVEQDNLSLEGKQWPAYRLNFETFDLEPNGKKIHPPVDVWVSRDQRRLPLRLGGNYSFGEVDIRLRKISKSRHNGVSCRNWTGFH
jgi:hypothetical protein